MDQILLTLPAREDMPHGLLQVGGFWNRVYPKLGELDLESGGVVGGRWIVKGQSKNLDVFEKWYKWLLDEPN